jgi:hypothetical protein
MKRPLMSFCIILVCFLFPQRAEAQENILDKLSQDLGALSVNTPIWLSTHLPAMMGQSGMGAGIELSSDGGGGLSFGLIALNMGFMNQFNEVGKGTEMLGLEEALPNNIPWPQFGATLGLGLGGGFEIGADLRFIPETDLAMGELISTTVGLIAGSASMRWRINEPGGAMPAIVLGVSGGYHSGTMKIGAGFKSAYAIPASVPGGGSGTVEGFYEFTGSPTMEWELYQVAPEIRIGWEIGPFRPYLGVGVGFSFGEITGSSKLTATVTVEKIDGNSVDQAPLIHEDSTSYYSTPPAMFTLRPHVGFDVVLGIVAVTAQVELAVMTQDGLGTDLTGAAQSFDPSDGDILYNEASKDSTTSAALVTTLAARMQF